MEIPLPNSNDLLRDAAQDYALHQPTKVPGGVASNELLLAYIRRAEFYKRAWEQRKAEGDVP